MSDREWRWTDDRSWWWMLTHRVRWCWQVQVATWRFIAGTGPLTDLDAALATELWEFDYQGPTGGLTR